MTPSPPTDLRAALPALEIRDSAEDLMAYSYDGTAALQATPAAVVFPQDTAQVSAVL